MTIRAASFSRGYTSLRSGMDASVYSPSFHLFGSIDSLPSLPELNIAEDEETAINRYLSLLHQPMNALSNANYFQHLANPPTADSLINNNISSFNQHDTVRPVSSPFVCKTERLSPELSSDLSCQPANDSRSELITPVAWPAAFYNSYHLSSYIHPNANYWPQHNIPTVPLNYAYLPPVAPPMSMDCGPPPLHAYHQMNLSTTDGNYANGSLPPPSENLLPYHPYILRDRLMYPQTKEAEQPFSFVYGEAHASHQAAGVPSTGDEVEPHCPNGSFQFPPKPAVIHPPQQLTPQPVSVDEQPMNLSSSRAGSPQVYDCQSEPLVKYVAPFHKRVSRTSTRNTATNQAMTVEAVEKHQVDLVTNLDSSSGSLHSAGEELNGQHQADYEQKGLKPYECSTCGGRFSRKFHLTRHTKQRGCQGTPRLQYACNFCNKTFTRKDNLQEHIRLHSGQARVRPRLPCPIPSCGKLLQGRTQLQVHLNSHSGTRPFSCDRDGCHKTFTSKATLKKHLRIHNNQKPFQCPQCDLRFTAKETLTQHLTIHSPNVAIKSKVCKKCGAAFVQQYALDRHMAEKHASAEYECNHCQRRYKVLWRMELHIKLEHPIPPPPVIDLTGSRESSDELQGQHSSTSEADQAAPQKDDVVEGSAPTDSTTSHPSETVPPCQSNDLAVEDRKIKSDPGSVELEEIDFRNCFDSLSETCLVAGRSSPEPPSLCGSVGSPMQATKDRLDNGVNPSPADICASSGLDEGESSSTDEKIPDVEPEAPQFSDPAPTPTPAHQVDVARFQENIIELLNLLIEPAVLKNLGWPGCTTDSVLQAIVVQCGKIPNTDITLDLAERLATNVRMLFSFIVDDQDALDTILEHKPIEQVLQQVIDHAKSSESYVPTG